MIRLFGRKSKGRVVARKAARAVVSVEGLEGRELPTAFTLVDTLNARDTINIQELNVIASIQNLGLASTAQFQQLIADGQARTNALANAFAGLVASEANATSAAQLAAIRAEEAIVLQSGALVRGYMRKATVVENTVQTTLLRNAGSVITTFNHTQTNLSHGNNPFLTVPHAINALNSLGLQAQQHAASGAAQLTVLDNLINGPLLFPQG
jgi:hypothetical protein